MENITFNPDGARIHVSFNFLGLVVASYGFVLWEAQSNHQLMECKGNNQNPDDDEYDLPLPVKSNDGRLIQLRTEFTGLDPENSKEYDISVEVHQGNDKIGELHDKGTITGKMQSSLLFVQLKANWSNRYF